MQNNKIIVAAMAAVLVTPLALAETANVNVYGTIDGGMRSVTTAGTTATNFGTGIYNSNRWGIKGTEDMGDGLKANFVLEGGFSTGTGALASSPNLFGRIATVGVIGGFGKIDLGRQFTVSFKAINAYQPFGQNYISLTNSFATPPSLIFNDNNISYTAKFDDLVVMAERTVPSTGNGSTSVSALGFRYVTDTVIAGAAYTATKPAATVSLADRKHYTAGGGLRFGGSKVYVGYVKDETTATGPTTTGAKASYMWLGATYDVSPKIGVTAAYFKRATEAAATVAVPAAELRGSSVIVAGTYALSKRTNFYIEADRTTAEAQALILPAAVTSSDTNGYSLGVAHLF